MSRSQSGGSVPKVELQQHSTNLGLLPGLGLPSFMAGLPLSAGLHGNSQLDMSKLMKMMPGTLPFPISSEGFHNMRETVLSEVDFWTEDENRNFCNAIGMAMDSNNKFAPDWDVVAARVGNKSKDQCQSYYKFYNVALQDSKKRAEREGKAAVKEIKAEEVFEFLGVRSDYLNFLRNRPTGELGKGAAAVLTGGSAGSGIGGGTTRSSKGSIDFLCGGDDRPRDKKDDRDALAHPSASPSQRKFGAGPVDFKSHPASRHSPISHGGVGKKKMGSVFSATAVYGNARSTNGTPTDFSGAKLPGGGGVGGIGTKGGVAAGMHGGQATLAKRKRPDSPPTKEKDREVDKNRINKRDMWSYACMSQLSKEELQREMLLDEETKVNPWEWTRKLICRPNGYSQWIPHFHETILLSKRQVSDDMRTIRDKAPPPPPPADRRAGELMKNGPRKDAPVHEWIYNGCSVEVKWESDWWHAKVKKMKPPKGGAGLEKVFVSYVGGTEEDDEWIPVSKIRAPREDVEEKLAAKKRAGGAKGLGKGR